MSEDRMLNDEILLGLIKANSGGGGGTTDYEDLNNLPKINSVELKGNKSLSDLGIASATDLANKVDKVDGKGLSTNDFTDAYKTAIGGNTTAINAIKDGQSIDSFADVETALATKQNALTAGTYIQMDNGVISVKRDITETDQTLYYHITILTDNTINVAKSLNGVKVSDTVYNWSNVSASPVNVDGCFTISTSGTNWVFTNLIASTTQPVGYQKTLYKSDARYDYSTTYVTTVDTDKKLIIQSELDDAMATKANTDMVAADFNAGTSYTAGNYCIYEGKFYKFKNNHSGAWSAADVDEIKIAGELSALKSGLTNAIYRKTITAQTASIGSDFVNVINTSDMSANGYIDITLSYGGYSYICRFNAKNSYQKCLVTSSITLELEMTSSYVRLKLVGASTTGTVSKITQDYIV